MTSLTLEELVSYFFYAQVDVERSYTELDFVRLIDELGLESANVVRDQVVQQLAEGHRLEVIRALFAA